LVSNADELSSRGRELPATAGATGGEVAGGGGAGSAGRGAGGAPGGGAAGGAGAAAGGASGAGGGAAAGRGGGGGCGDGTLNRAAEECDDGNASDGDGCDAACKVECPVGEPNGDVVRKNPADGACYWVRKEVKTFDEALAGCAALGRGFAFASVCGAGDVEFLKAQLPPPFHLWAGGRQASGRANPADGWAWVDGTDQGECDLAALWFAGEPNDGDGVENAEENCSALGLESGVSGTYDRACSSGYFYLCKRSPAAVSSAP
jgi:cysteine-rich repeat protein